VVEVKKGNSKPRRKDNTRMQKKIMALWFALAEYGKTNGRIPALNKFIKRQTGIESVEWVKTHDQAKKVIEALKAFATREGVVLK